MIYSFLLVIGVLGYGALMLLGFVHGGSHNSGSGHSAGAGSHAHTGVGSSGHHGGIPVKTGIHAKTFHIGKGKGSGGKFLSFSPLDLFSLCMGAGLTGRLLDILWRGHPELAPLVAIGAFVGALAFTLLFIKPLTRFILQFASSPSKGLEGMVAQFAVAETAFDATGKGIVTVTMDGQICRMLATLEGVEHDARIRKGDRLLVLDVDPTNGKCHVSAEFIPQEQTTIQNKS